MNDTIEARVARGAALLDEKLPGWVDRIDLDRLSLASPCRCILGQTWDEPTEHEEPYFLHVKRLFGRLDLQREVDHGFNVFTFQDDGDYDDLEAEWRRVIEARRAGAEVSR